MFVCSFAIELRISVWLIKHRKNANDNNMYDTFRVHISCTHVRFHRNSDKFTWIYQREKGEMHVACCVIFTRRTISSATIHTDALPANENEHSHVVDGLALILLACNRSLARPSADNKREIREYKYCAQNRGEHIMFQGCAQPRVVCFTAKKMWIVFVYLYHTFYTHTTLLFASRVSRNCTLQSNLYACQMCFSSLILLFLIYSCYA